MKFNIYISCNNGTFNIFNLEEEQVNKVVKGYKEGLNGVTINYKKYHFRIIDEIAIITNEKGLSNQELENYANEFSGSFGIGLYSLDIEKLSQFGKNVTHEFLSDEPFGYGKERIKIDLIKGSYYINKDRLTELIEINSTKFDLSKLVRICEELNNNWNHSNYFTVGLLLRTIINHVPPIFGSFKTFDEVVGNYGSQSFKKNMKHLNDSLRSIADGYTHLVIRNKEALPNEQQVDYRSNLDVLLSEIITKLHS